MVDPTLRRLLFGALFLSLAALVSFAHLLPFGRGLGRMPGPDVIVLLTFAWVLRRPDYLPIGLVAVVMLASDILFMRPPGLWTALVLIGTEFLRSRGHQSAELPFAAEWAMVSAVLVAMTLGRSVLMAVFFVPQPAFAQVAMQLALSVAVYPAVVLVCTLGLGVRARTQEAAR